MVNTLCGIVYRNGDEFLAKIAYAGVEGRSDNRASAIEASVKRFKSLYADALREGVSLPLNGNYDPAKLAEEERVELSGSQRWVVESTRTLSISNGSIELTFYRPGNKQQQVSHPESVDLSDQAVEIAK